jgi:hypothetical protein
MYINQGKYINNLLKISRMELVKEFNTPMGTSTKLDMDENGKNIDIIKYQGMIGSPLYLTTSIPNIMFSVCLYARFQACPKESHVGVVKCIFLYLHGTINLGLWYPKGYKLNLISYLDADFTRYKVNRKKN